MRKGLRFGCGLVFVLLIGAALAATWCLRSEKRARLDRQDAAINDRSPIRPSFLRVADNCDHPNAAAERLDRAMVEVANAAAPLDPKGQSPALNYVVSHFAWHWRISANGGEPRCKPDQALIDQIVPWLNRIGWPAVNVQRNDLRLVERLPPNSVRGRGLAAIGFAKYPPPQNIDFYDSRPLAMELLADQGRFAEPWRDTALTRMEADSAIGTAAAQVAVVTDPAVALPRVAKLITDKLARASRVKAHAEDREVSVLEGRDANRLIELGYAMARGGAAARPFAQPVIAMLDQRIARSAPPFGLFATPPTEFCRIARAIGGSAAEAANQRRFCAADFKGGDGAPSDL